MAAEDKQSVVPESAPAGVPRDPVERKAWYDKMRLRMGQSRIKVGKVPGGITIYWARKDDVYEMSRLDSMGFKVVRDDPKNPRFDCHGLREDGTYVMGDVILMEISTELYEFYKMDNADRARMLVEGVPQGFINNAASQDVPAFPIDEHHKRVR